MRYLITAGVLLLTVFSLHAEFAGFEAGNGVAITGGVVRVNYMANKSHMISLGPQLSLRLLEVQITMTNGKVKRQTMLFAGTHALRAPLPIELVEIVGPLCLLAFLCGIVIMVMSWLRRTEPGAEQNSGVGDRLGHSSVSAGPPLGDR